MYVYSDLWFFVILFCQWGKYISPSSLSSVSVFIHFTKCVCKKEILQTRSSEVEKERERLGRPGLQRQPLHLAIMKRPIILHQSHIWHWDRDYHYKFQYFYTSITCALIIMIVKWTPITYIEHWNCDQYPHRCIIVNSALSSFETYLWNHFTPIKLETGSWLS